MKRLSITKRGWVTSTALVAVLGITFSLLAESSGSVTMPTTHDSASHHITTAYTPPANPAGGVGLDTMGVGASLAAADYTDTPAVTTAASTNTSTSPAQNPSEPVWTHHTITTPPTPVTPPSAPCTCPTHYDYVGGHLVPQPCTTCPSPTAPPACQPCGGYRRLSNGAAICPMYMCASMD
jgi:hypothetical protein